jgi:predicted small secreted protein
MRLLRLFLIAAALCAVAFVLATCNDSGGGDDDDDVVDSFCVQCDRSADCQDALGNNWMCVGDCCENVGDDDDTAGTFCEETYEYMYIDCEWTFIDEYGDEISLPDVIGWCEAGEGEFAADSNLTQCIAVSACDDIPDCL